VVEPSPYGSGLMPQPPAWPLEDAEESVSVGVKGWLPGTFSERWGDGNDDVSLRFRYLSDIVGIGSSSASAQITYDDTDPDPDVPTAERIDVPEAGTWGGWEPYDDRLWWPNGMCMQHAVGLGAVPHRGACTTGGRRPPAA